MAVKAKNGRAAKANGADCPGPAPRTKATPGARKREVAIELAELRAAATLKSTSRQSARELVGKDLAAWVMWFRGQFDELYESIQEVWFATVNEDSLLHGLFPDDRLGDIFSAMQAIDGRLPLLVPKCPRPHPTGYAKGFVESWGL